MFQNPKELESICLEAIKKGDFKTVEHNFGPYTYYSQTNECSCIIKAYMLLYYRSTEQTKLFNTLIETIRTKDELNNEDIKIVLNVEKYIEMGAYKRLEELLKKPYRKEYIPFIREILNNQRKYMEEICSKNTKNLITTEQDERKNIADALYAGKNAHNF